jgi:hypothetical protein
MRASSCESPDDCPENQTCGRSGRCVVGDCTFSSTGCVVGFSCAKVRGYWQCVPEDDAENPGGGGTSAGMGGAAAVQGGEGGTSEGGSGGTSDAGAGGTSVE